MDVPTEATKNYPCTPFDWYRAALEKTRRQPARKWTLNTDEKMTGDLFDVDKRLSLKPEIGRAHV